MLEFEATFHVKDKKLIHTHVIDGDSKTKRGFIVYEVSKVKFANINFRKHLPKNTIARIYVGNKLIATQVLSKGSNGVYANLDFSVKAGESVSIGVGPEATEWSMADFPKEVKRIIAEEVDASYDGI